MEFSVTPLTLRSIPHHYDVAVSKKQVLHVIPDSIIGQQIKQEPDVSVIEFTLLIITPPILDLVTAIVQGSVPTPTLSPETNYVDAMNYLGINLGMLLPLDVSPVNITPSTPMSDYARLMEDGIIKNSAWKLLYLMQKFRPDLTKIADEKNLRMATEVGRLDVVNWMLFRGVDPRFDQNVSLRMASQQGYADIVDSLLAWNADPDPRVDPTILDNAPLNLAIENRRTRVAIRLLSDPRVSQKLTLNGLLSDIVRAGDVDLFNLFADDLGITPRMIYDALKIAVRKGDSDMVERLLQHPLADVRTDNYALFHVSPHQADMDAPLMSHRTYPR